MTSVTERTTRDDRFVKELEGLVKREDRAALAALRRTAGKLPDEAVAAFPYVMPWLPRDPRMWEERAYFLVAGLFALHPPSPDQTEGERRPANLGASFAALRRKAEERGGGESIERRFVALLNSHADDLPEHLRQAISLLRSGEVPVDWRQLLRDIQRILAEGERRYMGGPRVQRQWARAFWGAAASITGESSSTNTNDENDTTGEN